MEADQAKETAARLAQGIGTNISALNADVKFETDDNSYIRVYITSDCKANCNEEDCCSDVLARIQEAFSALEQGDFSRGAAVIDPNMARMFIKSFKGLEVKQVDKNRALVAYEIRSNKLGIMYMKTMFTCMQLKDAEKIAECFAESLFK
ncbi:MAG: hypothetical protein ACP5I3_10030 [Thermoproteus sp.]